MCLKRTPNIVYYKEMRPQEPSASQPSVRVPNRANYSLVPSRTTHPGSSQDRSQQAAADIARRQLDNIYSSDPNSLMAVEAEPTSQNPQPTPQSPIAQTPQQPTPQIVKKSKPHLGLVDNQTASDNADISTSATPRQSIQTESLAKAQKQPTAPSTNLTANAKFESNQETQPVEKISSQQPEAENPYERSYASHDLQSNAAEWKQYHSAWQQYYQQYFHRYYSTQLASMQAQKQTEATKPQELTPEEAMDDIRSKLRSQIRERATKVRKSRHFMPIAAALGVMLVFTFLQYNRVLFSNIQAYTTPGSVEPSNIIVDPTVNIEVGPEPKLIIPKVNIDVPVDWNARPDHDSQMKAMENGVAWFGIPGANSKPGQIGNTVISGHSSNDWIETGNYKFIFAPLHRLTKDDTIYINYKGVRYTYVVTKIDVVKPTEVSALTYETDKPVLTLITCTPLGTALNRLLITAEQVSPSPSDAKPKPGSSKAQKETEMPGVQPTVIERLFGAER